MASEIRVNQIQNRSGLTTTTFTNTGVTISGILTVSGNLNVGGVLTYEDVANIDAVGVITARSDLSIADKIIHTGDTNTAIRFPAADTITAETSGSERLRIASNGDFGLNDTSPTAHASGNNTVLSIKGKGSSYSGKIDFKDSDGNIDSYINSDNSVLQIYADPNSQNGNTSMLFHVHGGERLRIGRHGQIGIAGANYGTSGQFLQSQGASSAVQWASVSSDLQFAQWRVTTPFGGGNVDPITNWSQTDANATLTQSGGIFSFPSTGYWEIMMQMYGYKNTDNDNIELHIMTTTNNSSYTTRSWAYSHMNNDDGGNLYVSIRASLVFDVTNTSTHKIKFKTINNTVNWAADSGRNDSYAIFKRLAAT